MSHCPACEVAERIATHRDTCEPDWSPRRAAFSFAVVIAQRACPDHRDATDPSEER